MPASPVAPPDDTDRLFLALSALEPRPLRLLTARFVDGKTDGELARLFGMPDEAYAVHLLRAARAFQAALAPGPAGPAPAVAPEGELAEGWALLRALSAGAAPPAGLAPLWEALRRLEAQREPLRRRLDEAARAELDSPAARRETAIRRALIGALVAVTVWLYLTR